MNVYLEDKEHIVLSVDKNSGFDYAQNTIIVGRSFTLIFSGRSFEKRMTFDRPDNCDFEYHLDAVLSKVEIKSSYDREEAIDRIQENATAYSFEQLAAVGEIEDIELLYSWLSAKSLGVDADDLHRNYLIARCADALGKLCIKYHSFERAAIISKVYDKYKAKKSYGYYFENIIKNLTVSKNEEFIQQHFELLQKAENGDSIAQYSLGEIYADKKSVFKDYKKHLSGF